MFCYVTFSMKYYILSQIFYKKIDDYHTFQATQPKILKVLLSFTQLQ